MRRAVGKASKREAPAIAAINAKDAQDNLVRKRDVLVAALRASSQRVRRAPTADDHPLESLPMSVRQFNKWSIPAEGGISCRALRSSSNDTLRRYPELKEQIVSLIEAIREARNKYSGATRVDSLASLRRRLKLAERLRSIAEVELVQARVKLVSLSSEVQRLHAALDSSVAAYREQMDRLRLQLTEAKTQLRAAPRNRQ